MSRFNEGLLRKNDRPCVTRVARSGRQEKKGVAARCITDISAEAEDVVQAPAVEGPAEVLRASSYRESVHFKTPPGTVSMSNRRP